MFFKQIKTRGSDNNFSYLAGDEQQKEICIIVDPAYELEKILKIAEGEGYSISHILLTHRHYDHSQLASECQRKTGAKIVIGKNEEFFLPQGHTNQNQELLRVEDGQKLILSPNLSIRTIWTPGHTEGAICYQLNSTHFITGDTLFIGRCGRVDFSGGSAEAMIQSLKKITVIAHQYPDLIMYPGHDYGEVKFRNLLEECQRNPSVLAENVKSLSISTRSKT
ncbi:MBL fold metallo-hydrolase [Candidatus Riflebacteria bacterium]